MEQNQKLRGVAKIRAEGSPERIVSGWNIALVQRCRGDIHHHDGKHGPFRIHRFVSETLNGF